MSGADHIPSSVLSQQLSEQIQGRRVRTAVFTTFTFDPGFFEINILPLLFDQTFSQSDTGRLLQLEDALLSLNDLTVYYDRHGLAPDSDSSQLTYNRIDVRRKGVFHPKVILLLVDEHSEEYEEGQVPHQALIVALQSANLTRAGWWESVECAHVEEIKDKERDQTRIPYRTDLLQLLQQIEKSAAPGEDHHGLQRIRDFLRQRTVTRSFSRMSGQYGYRTQIFCGQKGRSFSDWLQETGVTRETWNLEIISPFFSPTGAGPLNELLEVLEPKETRVYLPREPDGTALVSKKTYAAIDELAYWSDLPIGILQRGSGAGGEKLNPRSVHAKVYRLWQRRGRDLLIVGSVNLTDAAHSKASAGNLEAAFLVDVTGEGYPRRWWLQTRETEPSEFVAVGPDETEGQNAPPLDLSLRFDWENEILYYRVLKDNPASFTVCDAAKVPLFEVDSVVKDEWRSCDVHHSTMVISQLKSSSILSIRYQEESWRVLVQEINVARKPCIYSQLTPEEILQYWALLTPEQRSSFIENTLAAGLQVEGLPVVSDKSLSTQKSLFDRFAGVFHAFACLERTVTQAIEEGRRTEADTKMFGTRYDSLPVLLEKVRDRTDGDSITRYITFLTAEQLYRKILKLYLDTDAGCPEGFKHLRAVLDELPKVRAQVELEDKRAKEFITWYEQAFIQHHLPVSISR